MATRTGTAHVVTTTRRYKDRVYHTHLLRRSYREDGKVKNETLGNLSHLPESEAFIGVRHQFRCGALHRTLRASRRLGEFGL